MDVNQLFKFIRLTQKFRSVVRDVAVDEGKRMENDMEHSYQLAMLLWYLVSTHKLPYDINKLLKYALVHDLVEIYAGDTPALTSSKEEIALKGSKEDQAIKRLAEEFPEFSELEQWWNDYHSKSDKESRLVYVVDKVMPILNELQQDSGFYKQNHISLAKWLSWLKSKLDAVSFDELNDGGFIDTLVKYLDQEKARLFPKNS